MRKKLAMIERKKKKKRQAELISKGAKKEPADNKNKIAASQLAMVDVASKEESLRTAEARGKIAMSAQTLNLILKNEIPKGNVLVAARLAGIQAVKKTAELIPLCHPLRITSVEVEIKPQARALQITARVSAFDRTGVEMEALTAVAGACLTVYDMAKAFDKRMVIGDIHLIRKTGGRSGPFQW